jgi:hypothetical protein
MSILILAEDIDATADKMVRTLADRDVVVHRVNIAWFPAAQRFRWAAWGTLDRSNPHAGSDSYYRAEIRGQA